VTVCDEDDLLESEAKEFKLRDNLSCLVVKQNGKVYALGNKCTHYGAPLVEISSPLRFELFEFFSLGVGFRPPDRLATGSSLVRGTGLVLTWRPGTSKTFQASTLCQSTGWTWKMEK
jgi:hypothetical protein